MPGVKLENTGNNFEQVLMKIEIFSLISTIKNGQKDRRNARKND
jgi:hypothetical protein